MWLIQVPHQANKSLELEPHVYLLAQYSFHCALAVPALGLLIRPCPMVWSDSPHPPSVLKKDKDL